MNGDGDHQESSQKGAYTFNVSSLAAAFPDPIEAPHKMFALLNVQIFILHPYVGGNSNLRVFKCTQDLSCLVKVLLHVAQDASHVRSYHPIAEWMFDNLLEFIDNQSTPHVMKG